VSSADCPAVPVAEVHSECDWACRLACTRVAGHEGYTGRYERPPSGGASPVAGPSRATGVRVLGSARGVLARLPDRSGARTFVDAIRAAAISPFGALHGVSAFDSQRFLVDDAPGISLDLHRSQHLDGGGGRALAAREASLAATTAAVDACEVARAASSARPAAGCPEARSEPRQDARGARIGRGAGDGHPLLAGWAYPLRRSLP
jgi:hypothetical protein